jgi:predicted AlkP superfamily pyrophosphatase or phosphodiesterase
MAMQIPLAFAAGMPHRVTRLWGLVLGLLVLPPQLNAAPPHLVVLVTVDQLRGDYLERYRGQWRGAFARMLSRGAVFPNARQAHAITETAPGHATLLSGRNPAHNGIPSNYFGVPDQDFPLVGVNSGNGASPHRFRGSTLVDWLRAKDPDSRFLSVSGKDRGAILPTGSSRGPVFWYATGRFVTSRYYADTLPSWLAGWNSRGAVSALAGRSWTLLLPDTAYAEPDSMPFEQGGRDVTFPHRVPDDPDKAMRQALGFPWMDSLTLDVALEGTRNLQLGRRGGTDVLAISLSTTDYVGHEFGPDSRELHDQLLRLDRTLGWFLDSLNTLLKGQAPLVILTGDHGVTSYPEAARLKGRPGGRVSPTGFQQRADSMLKALSVKSPGLYFDSGLLTADLGQLRTRGLDIDSVAAALADILKTSPGVVRVYTRRTLPDSSDADAGLWRRSLPDDLPWLLCASLSPGYIWSDDTTSTTHGSTNPDDLSVPIVFMGSGVRSGLFTRSIETVDIAPTLAVLLRVKPFEPLDGRAVVEVVGKGS